MNQHMPACGRPGNLKMHKNIKQNLEENKMQKNENRNMDGIHSMEDAYMNDPLDVCRFMTGKKSGYVKSRLRWYILSAWTRITVLKDASSLEGVHRRVYQRPHLMQSGLQHYAAAAGSYSYTAIRTAARSLLSVTGSLHLYLQGHSAAAGLRLWTMSSSGTGDAAP